MYTHLFLQLSTPTPHSIIATYFPNIASLIQVQLPYTGLDTTIGLGSIGWYVDITWLYRCVLIEFESLPVYVNANPTRSVFVDSIGLSVLT
jgi:hypothetical protein